MTDLLQLIAELKTQHASESKVLEDLRAQIISMLEAVAAFKSSGMYREARYTAGFVGRLVDEFLKPDPNNGLMLCTRAALAEVLALPNLSPRSRSDTLAPKREDTVGVEPGPYQARFPVGTRVRVADEAELRAFKQSWKLHHPLRVSQLRFAGLVSTVSDVSYYHGGDALYTLADTGSYIWHEPCLHNAQRSWFE